MVNDDRWDCVIGQLTYERPGGATYGGIVEVEPKICLLVTGGSGVKFRIEVELGRATPVGPEMQVKVISEQPLSVKDYGVIEGIVRGQVDGRISKFLGKWLATMEGNDG